MIQERRKAAEEKKRTEELKAQVCAFSLPLRQDTDLTHSTFVASLVSERLRDYDAKPVVRRRLHIDLVLLGFSFRP